ncbi:MAG: circadian clock protein KaiC [Ferruginibacter sp.]
MSTSSKTKQPDKLLKRFPKTPTGIQGLDEITGGGLPMGRPTLVCGASGCGKTLLAMEFIVRGAMEFNEPGVFVAFEEKIQELALNVASLGFDLEKLQKNKKIKLDYVHIDKSEIEETGEYDLDGLFIRLGYAIDSIGAKRVVLDTIENLFSGLLDEGILRAELRRLFEGLKAKGVTAIITGEKGEGTLTRHGLEEYVSDCVILLDNRVSNQIATRLLRIVKYRGSTHGSNEYPFLIDEDGISVLPVTSLKLDRAVSSARVSSGIPSLNNMLGGKGYFAGSSILISGTAGTGKTSIAGYFAHETCKRKERCIYFAFEESPQQIIRNMRSISIDLQQHVDSGYLKFHASRPTLNGLEMHLVSIHKIVKQFKPKVVIIDPTTNLISIGTVGEVKFMLIRLIDFLQSEQITVMLTALTLNQLNAEQTDEGLSSLVDTWLTVKDIETNGERNRGLYIMKSRGMDHSNQVREFIISDKGVELVDVYIGNDGVLIGSARLAKELEDEKGSALRMNSIDHKNRVIQRKESVLAARIASLQEEFETLKEELNKSFLEEDLLKEIAAKNRAQLMQHRHGAGATNGKKK